jgi:hypothetical protein
VGIGCFFGLNVKTALATSFFVVGKPLSKNSRCLLSLKKPVLATSMRLSFALQTGKVGQDTVLFYLVEILLLQKVSLFVLLS